MNKLDFWKPIIIGIIATPIFSLVAMSSAGVGHGSYLPMLIFYPFSFFLLSFGIAAYEIEDAFLKMIIGNGISVLAIGIAIIQFPLYGFFISYSRTRKETTWFAVWEIIIWIHIVISVVVLLFTLITTLL